MFGNRELFTPGSLLFSIKHEAQNMKFIDIISITGINPFHHLLMIFDYIHSSSNSTIWKIISNFQSF